MAVDPIIKQKAEDIRNKIYGKEVRESLASGIEAMSEDVVSVTGRQATVEEQFQAVIDETTGKDVISAPEIILARGGAQTLGERFDEDKAEVTAQLQQTEQNLNVQLAQKVGGGKKAELEDLSGTVLSAIEGGEGTSFGLLSVPQNKSVSAKKLSYSLAEAIGIRDYNLFDGNVVQGTVRDVDGALIYETDPTRSVTDFIKIEPLNITQTNILELRDGASSYQTVTFYDENKVFVDSIYPQTSYFIPPANAHYMRQNVGSSSFNIDLERYEVFQKKAQNISFPEIVSAFNLETNEIYDKSIVYGNIDAITGDLILTSDTDRMATNFLPIEPGVPVTTNWLEVLNGSNSTQGVAFYDESKHFLGMVVTENNTVTPLGGAVYMRQNLKTTTSSVRLNEYSVTQYDTAYSKTLININDKVEAIGKETDIMGLSKQINVIDFDEQDKTDDEIISTALDFSKSFKNRKIVFSSRDWIISEAIIIPSDTEVIVDGCSIVQADETFDNVFRGDNLVIDQNDPYGYPLEVNTVENIKITGMNGAKIIGPDVNKKGYHPILDTEQDMVGDYWGWRTLQICFSKAKNIEISGFEFIKQRCWAISFDRSQDFKVHDLVINSTVKNGDGVDVRAGCKNFEIYNITGSTTDDTVAMTAAGHSESTINYPRVNYVYPLEPTRFENLSYSKEELAIEGGYVHDIFTTGWAHGVICLSADGIPVRDIFIDRVQEPSASYRESVVKIYELGGYTDNLSNNIKVNDVISKGADFAVMTTVKVDNVWFNKIVQENANGTVSSIEDMNGVTITNS